MQLPVPIFLVDLCMFRQTMFRALSDGQCNIVQLTSEVKKVRKHDKEGKLLPVPEWPEQSWETRTFANLGVRRSRNQIHDHEQEINRSESTREERAEL